MRSPSITRVCTPLVANASAMLAVAVARPSSALAVGDGETPDAAEYALDVDRGRRIAVRVSGREQTGRLHDAGSAPVDECEGECGHVGQQRRLPSTSSGSLARNNVGFLVAREYADRAPR